MKLVVHTVEVWVTESRIALDSRRCRTNKLQISAERTIWPAMRRIGKTLGPGGNAVRDVEISKKTLKFAGQLVDTVQLDCASRHLSQLKLERTPDFSNLPRYASI